MIYLNNIVNKRAADRGAHTSKHQGANISVKLQCEKFVRCWNLASLWSGKDFYRQIEPKSTNWNLQVSVWHCWKTDSYFHTFAPQNQPQFLSFMAINNPRMKIHPSRFIKPLILIYQLFLKELPRTCALQFVLSASEYKSNARSSLSDLSFFLFSWPHNTSLTLFPSRCSPQLAPRVPP